MKNGLHRRLMACGTAGSAQEATALQSQLRPGQHLTTKDGGLWRWDGYTALPGKVPGAARLLEQRRRADELESVLSGLQQQQISRSTDPQNAIPGQPQ